MANGTIAFDTLTTSDSVKSGTEKSIDTSYIFNGVAKQWSFFNQQTPAIGDSLNTASITDNSAGDYTVNLTNSMGSTNFSVSGCSVDIGSYLMATTGRLTFSTSSYELNCCDSGFTKRDPDDASNSVLGVLE